MSIILAVANQKGGVGKTTACVNLAAALSEAGQRVLVVDLDPQGNATMGAGVDKHDVRLTMCDLLLGDATPDQVVQQRHGLHVLPANADLTAAEVALMAMAHRQRRLADVLQGVIRRYEYIVVDCPPSLNMLTLNALVAAHGVVVPVQCEYYALEGLSALMQTIRQVQQTANQALKVVGLLRTMFDPRNNLANEVSAQLILHFGDVVFRTIVPRNIRLAEAPSHGLPAIHYDRASRGSVAYRNLAGEIMRRQAQAA